MTDDERARALAHEREGYAARGLDDRVKEVDAQLKELGRQATAPAKRARKQVRKAPEKR